MLWSQLAYCAAFIQNSAQLKISFITNTAGQPHKVNFLICWQYSITELSKLEFNEKGQKLLYSTSDLH